MPSEIVLSTEHLTLPHSGAKSGQSCRSRYDGAPPLTLQQAFTCCAAGHLQPTQAHTNATNYPAGVRTLIPHVASFCTTVLQIFTLFPT